jgi:hypothetical protein
MKCGKDTIHGAHYQIVMVLLSFTTIDFGSKTTFKSVKRSFWTVEKNCNNRLKNTNFDPHAAKALNK